MSEPVDYDDLRKVTRGEVDALHSDMVQLRIRLDRLATNAELAGFHGLNLAALLTQCLPYVDGAERDIAGTDASRYHAAKLARSIRSVLGVE